MTLSGPVLVGTDLSTAADEALKQASQLANSLGCRLIVCHVVPELIPDSSVFAEFRRAHLAAEQSILATARAAVQQQLDTVLGAANADLEVALESGTPHVGLLAQANATGAGVIVTGPGSVPLDVVRHTTSALLVARRAARGPVVGATDFSDPAFPAIRLAALEAARRGVPLHLVHAFDSGLFALGGGPAAAMPYLVGTSPIALEGLDELRNIAKRQLEEMLREVGTPGETVVVSGSAAHVIVQHAESVGAELVVVGTHGRSGFARLTLGRTAASVVESAPCSVLVTRLNVN